MVHFLFANRTATTRSAGSPWVPWMASSSPSSSRGEQMLSESSRRGARGKMKKGNTVTRKWGDHRKGKTDWARVDALTDEEVEAAIASDPDWQEFRDIDWSDAVLVIPPKEKAINAASTRCCARICSRRQNPKSGRECFSSRHLPLQKPPRSNSRQPINRPVVDIGPGLARGAVFQRDRKHLPDILGRLR